MLEAYLRALRKLAERLMIQNILAPSIVQRASMNDTTVKFGVKQESVALKKTMNDATETFESVVKGQFGTRAREAIGNETGKVNELM